MKIGYARTILDFGGNTIEREVMLERQRVGIARAKAEGKYKGRNPTACNLTAEVRKLVAAGVTKVEIARRLTMHRASVYRILGASGGSPSAYGCQKGQVR